MLIFLGYFLSGFFFIETENYAIKILVITSASLCIFAILIKIHRNN